MKQVQQQTLKEYTDILSQKTPVPGGGSAAALTGALGASLLAMVARYSVGKSSSKRTNERIKRVLREADKARKRLLVLSQEDVKAYEAVVKTRAASAAQKRKAQKTVRKVPEEVCRLCYKTVGLAPCLVKEGNQNLVSDVEAAAEMLLAGFSAARVFTR